MSTIETLATIRARSPGLRVGFRLLLLLLLLATGAPCVAREMEDPLLGLSFDPARIRFETLSTLPCPAPDAGDHPPYFVFAHARVDGARYWVLNHWQPTGGDGGTPAHTEPAFGLVVARSARRCEILATPDALLAGSGQPLESIRAPLLVDAARRYRRAYGSDSALLEALQSLVRNPTCISADPALVEIWRLEGVRLPAACGTQPAMVRRPNFGSTSGAGRPHPRSAQLLETPRPARTSADIDPRACSVISNGRHRPKLDGRYRGAHSAPDVLTNHRSVLTPLAGPICKNHDGARSPTSTPEHPHGHGPHFVEVTETEPDNTLHCLIRTEVMSS